MKINLKMLKEHKEEIFKTLEQCSYCTANSNSQRSFALREDVKTLADNIIKYFEQFYPNTNFKDFYDKPFLDIMKYTIKNQELFYNFLNYVKYKDDVRNFINTAVYICPQVFTSAVSRFIREHYDLSQKQTTI